MHSFSGDLVSAFGDRMVPFIDNQNISALLARARRSKAAKTKSIALWALKEIRKLKSGRIENHN